jgi:Anti-sigma-K factor rskA, C-terminal
LTSDFDELVGGLEPEQRERLRRAHELLLEAGPLPELPPSLADAQPQPEAEIVPFFNRRRNASIALLAAAAAAAAFGIGYLTGHNGNSDFVTKHTVEMRAAPGAPAGAIGSIAVSSRDESGNWQMIVRVEHLEKLKSRAYYAVWLTRKGRAVAPCGYFVVPGNTNKVTEIRLTVPYKLSRFDGWVVTEQKPRGREPGRVVLTTV